MLFRYSRWDGTQEVADLDADDLLEAMADDIMADGDLRRALRRLVQRGARDAQGRQQLGLRDLLQRLERRRREALDRHDLASVLDDIRKKLEEVLRRERAGVQQRVQDPRERARKLQALDRLPPDPAGRIRALQAHRFTDPEAERLFQELLRELQQQMLQPFLQGLGQTLQGLTPEDLRRTREMLRDLNRLLAQRREGEEPDFEAFRQKWGQHFPGAASLDGLLDQLGRQAAAMQSLLRSLSPEQRGQLQDLMRSLFLRDERLEAEMAQLAASLGDLLPLDEMAQRRDFQGDAPLTLEEALRLMDELAGMDQLERELRGVRGPEDLGRLDPAEVERLLGPEAARDLEQLREATRKLEEAGYLEREGNRMELTARAMRKIGDRALREVFSHLRRDRFGRHVVPHRGAGGDRVDEVKPYEFGDPFLLDLRETLMNAVAREGPGTPVRLAPGDFAVSRTELSTRAATVVMLDLSRSMLYNGCFVPAKKVALALHALIRGQFPRDSLHVVGFSLYARAFAVAELPALSPGDTSIGTNMQAGLLLARQLLARDRVGNKQVIMITDGEPTAHLEGGQAEFSYPPTRRTLQETLREVQRCTREGITINTFMLERSAALTAFVEQMARLNRGRAFFTTPERLGEYVLVDYVRQRRRAAS